MKTTGRSAAMAAALALDDVRSMLRLAHELHEMPTDPPARKTHLLEALCRLVPADAGAARVAHLSPPAAPGRPTVLAAVYAGGAPAAAPWSEAEPAADPPASLIWTSDAVAPPWGRLFRRAIDRRGDRTALAHAPAAAAATLTHPAAVGRRASYGLYSLVPIARADARLVACLSLRRASRPFARRDRDLVHTLHREIRWLYRHDVPLAAPMVLSLAPRPRETLRLLLAGHSEKQIAARLKLSTNTVHHYVKTVYRHFAVSSRSELLARWVKES